MRLARITFWTHPDGRAAMCMHPEADSRPCLFQITRPNLRDLLREVTEEDCRDLLASDGFVWRMECPSAYVPDTTFPPPAKELFDDETTAPGSPSAKHLAQK